MAFCVCFTLRNSALLFHFSSGFVWCFVCICVIIQLFFLLLWNDFFCRCSCDNCCHTINGVSQKCAASVIIANVVESRSAGLSQVAPEISRHIFMASPARRVEKVQHRIIHSSFFLPVICGLTSLRLHYQAFLLQWQGLKNDSNRFEKIAVEEPLQLPSCGLYPKQSASSMD